MWSEPSRDIGISADADLSDTQIQGTFNQFVRACLCLTHGLHANLGAYIMRDTMSTGEGISRTLGPAGLFSTPATDAHSHRCSTRFMSLTTTTATMSLTASPAISMTGSTSVWAWAGSAKASASRAQPKKRRMAVAVTFTIRCVRFQGETFIYNATSTQFLAGSPVRALD